MEGDEQHRAAFVHSDNRLLARVGVGPLVARGLPQIKNMSAYELGTKGEVMLHCGLSKTFAGAGDTGFCEVLGLGSSIKDVNKASRF